MPKSSKKDSQSRRGRKKIGVYLPEDVIAELKQVGQDLHERGLGGNLSDVLRLVLTVCKKKGMLNAAELTHIASQFDTSQSLNAEAIQDRLEETG